MSSSLVTASLVTAARRMWERLAYTPGAFGDGVRVVVSPSSRLCPSGFVGIVTIGGGALITAPSEDLARMLRNHAALHPLDELTQPVVLATRFTVGAVLGPARLAYASTDTFRPAPEPDTRRRMVESLPGHDPEVASLLAVVDPEDAEECGIDGITSPAFVERDDGGAVVAVAGYRKWPGETAHLGVLTAPHGRGRGSGLRVSSQAVTHALDNGLLPQWRARVQPSIRVASRLGFLDLGEQLSARLMLAK